MSIASEIQNYNDGLLDAYNSVETMGGTIPSSKNLVNLPDAIESIPAGSEGGDPLDDVVFYDYDGAIVKTYTASEFANLTAMPSNPSHEGLTAQGWNWSLSDAKTYVAEHGMLDIGQMYVTSDGKTRLYIKLEEGRLDPYLKVSPINGEADIDWGDGTPHNTITSTSSLQHIYATAGEYVITIASISGTIRFHGESNNSNGSNLIWKNKVYSSGDARYENRAYDNCLIKVELGSNITAINNSVFFWCRSLQTITLPNTITTIEDYAFAYCSSLKSITLPSSLTSISNSNTFSSCVSLQSITIPNTLSSCYPTLNNCQSLIRLTLPNSMTGNTPQMEGCSSLNAISFGHATNIQTLKSAVSLQKIVIPSTVTSFVSSCFQNNESLKSIIVNCDIASNMFYYDYGLINVLIKENVTNIGSSAFMSCYGLKRVKFESSTPPTLGSSSFRFYPNDCKFLVPSGSKETYMATTGYPTSDSYYEEY